MAKQKYWISWKNAGDEHYIADITWTGAFLAEGLQDALLSLYEVEKRHTITEIVNISVEEVI